MRFLAIRSNSASSLERLGMPVRIDKICCDTSIEADLLTLIGIVNLNFNYAEHILRIFIGEYMQLDNDIADRIVLNMREGEVINLCRTIIPTEEADEEVRAACMAFLDNFDILSENRNIVAHSLVLSNTPETVSLLRTSKAGKFDLITLLREELSDLCLELRELFHFGMTIQGRFSTRKSGHKPAKLRPTPPKPRKLHLRQIAPNSDQLPPQS